MDALARNPDDKSVHQAIAMHHLRRTDYDEALVEGHLKKSFSSEDQNFEERYIYAQYLFLRGNVEGAATLFELIDRRAPENFRRTAPSKYSIITARLPRYTGTVESIKERFLFIRSGCYPRSIFAHYSHIELDILDSLSIGQEVDFFIRFNRAGPTAEDIKTRT
jgi:cold shock CspA family protein